MGEYCNQCSYVMFGIIGDFVGYTPEEDEANGIYALVICEGCGPIQVDHKGNCVSKDCLANTGKSPIGPHKSKPKLLGEIDANND